MQHTCTSLRHQLVSLHLVLLLSLPVTLLPLLALAAVQARAQVLVQAAGPSLWVPLTRLQHHLTCLAPQPLLLVVPTVVPHWTRCYAR